MTDISQYTHEHNFHVLADALTSVFALIALTGANFFHWDIPDALMGIVSSFLIFRWAYKLLRETSGILLDKETDSGISREIRELFMKDNTVEICNLHVWKIGPDKYNCMLSLLAQNPEEAEKYREAVLRIEGIAHSSVEIKNPRICIP